MSKEQIIVIAGILGSLVLIVGGALLFNNKRFGGNPADLLTHGRPVHWHAELAITVCGKDVPAPRAAAGGEIGSGPIHGHDDALAHMEGAFNKIEEIALKKYFQSVGVPFSEKGIYDKTDGSPCENTGSASSDSAPATGSATAGKLRGTINDVPVDDILNAPMHNPADPEEKQDKIHIIYE